MESFRLEQADRETADSYKKAGEALADMASPENWVKEDSNTSIMQWRHSRNASNIVKVVHSGTGREPSGYDVEAKIGHERGLLQHNLSSKDEARKRAVEWMQEHPNPGP